ncbi:MAG: enoyl-CoA hydratase/isomerase family protein [Bdellovibrionales bacterium]|nr:enoyl-CoA hydratase/isomerase family protein [Bdellovibrionales bacterium]
MSKALTHQWLADKVLNIDYCNLQSANSLTPELLTEVLSIIEEQQPLALIFTSSHPRVYCSGGNLKKYAQMTEAESRKSNQQMRELLDRFSKMPVHTVAFVTGDCFGGGLEFLSSFDEVHAMPYCLFGFWQKKQTLSFGWGGFERLKKRLSEKSLLVSLQNSQTLISSQALKLGLIDSVETDLNVLVNHISKCIRTENFKVIKGLQSKNETEVFESLWFSKDHKKKLEGRK